MNIQSFFRPQIQEIIPTYAPSVGWDGTSLKLDSGENMWCPQITIDWKNLIQESACYPDSTALRLREALASSCAVTPQQVAVGNGSDELIDLLCRIFINPGDTLVDFSPTFPMFTFFGKLSGARIVDVPRLSNFQIDMEKAKEVMSSAKLVFLANPNNPTGTLVSREDIVALAQVGIPLVVDEAYFEFAGESVIDLVSTFENLIVLRTFSKWAGIAGLRVGYMVAGAPIIEKVLAIKAPYNVNTVAQSVALQVLRSKEAFLPCIEDIQKARDWFVEQVNATTCLQAIPSKASCVTILCKVLDAKKLDKMLEDAGIFVKVLPDSLIKNSLRISIAPRKEMQKVLSALQTYASI